MFLLEHDAKQLLAEYGVPVPTGFWIDACGEGLSSVERTPDAAWVVKAQVAGGGRGKAGGVRRLESIAQATATLRLIADADGRLSDGRRVQGFRIEAAVDDAAEAYLSMAIDPPSGQVRVIASSRGGVDIEAVESGALAHELAALDAGEIAEAVRRAAARLPLEADPASGARLRAALSEAGERLAHAFVGLEAQLLEINPLFVRGDGRWIAGDAKLVTDDSALGRQPALRALLERSGDRYEDVDRKWRHGCDYVVVDPLGEIGLLTTGAGLSMMLIDELRARGLSPYNFLDVRTGGLRGDPRRLVDVLQWMTRGERLRVVLVNIFAGITDLAEFAGLLVQALDAVPTLRVPVVARLVGPGLEAARAQLAARDIQVETDLDLAVARVRERLDAGRA